MAKGKARAFTEREREQAYVLSAHGFTHEEIARALCCSKHTLYKYLKEELDRAVTETSYRVISKLMEKIEAGDTASILFWLKTRLGWRESAKIEHEVKGDKIRFVDAPPSETREEWEARRKNELRQQGTSGHHNQGHRLN